MSKIIENYLILPTEAAMLDFGGLLARLSFPGMLIFLEGQLGAGKTTLCRGFLQAFGYQGIVKSPTYTIVESYQCVEQWIYHFDFYRLASEEELEHLGFSDYCTRDAICLIEWPQALASHLPSPALWCKISLSNHTVGRQLYLSSHDQQLMQALNNATKKYQMEKH